MSTPADAPSTRRRLLDAAAVVFGERGYVDTSVKQIADQAGLTTGALYANFASKSALFLEVAADQYRDALVRTGPHGPRPTGVRDALERFARSYVGRVSEGSAHVLANSYELMTLMLRDVDGLAGVLAAHQGQHVLLRRYLELVAADDEADVDADHLAKVLVSLVGGATQTRVLAPDLVDLDALAATAGHLASAPLPRRPRAPAAPPAVDPLPLTPAHESAPAAAVPLPDVLSQRTLALRSGEATLLLLLPLRSLPLLGRVHEDVRRIVPDPDALRVVAVYVDDGASPGALAVVMQGLVDLSLHLPAAGEVLDLHVVVDHDAAVPDALGTDPARPSAVLLDRAGLVRATAVDPDLATITGSVAALVDEGRLGVGGPRRRT